MTSVASRPSYQSIQCAAAGWALRHPVRSYQSPCILTSKLVRQSTTSQAGTSTQSFNSSSHSHVTGVSDNSVTLAPLTTGGDSSTDEKRRVGCRNDDDCDGNDEVAVE